MKSAAEYAEDATAKMHDALIGVAEEEYSAAKVLALVGIGRALLANAAAISEAAVDRAELASLRRLGAEVAPLDEAMAEVPSEQQPSDFPWDEQ